jgi:hypothetical protein
MTNLKLSSSQNNIPEKWRERFYIKRIGENDIEISLEARDEILKALNAGTRFIQIGKYTLMLNSIKSIDPKWGNKNIPPRPEVRLETFGVSEKTGQMICADNKKDLKELKEWNEVFMKDKSLD